MPQQTKSAELFEKAKKFIPGGVNSPVRAFKSVGGNPIYMAKGSGAYLTDVDGNTYLDYVGSWGPFILGSMHPRITAALEYTLKNIGTSFGTPIEMEIEIAELLCKIVLRLKWSAWSTAEQKLQCRLFDLPEDTLAGIKSSNSKDAITDTATAS